MLEAIDKAQDSLDDLWRQPTNPVYLDDRMKHLLGITVDQFIGYVQEKLTSLSGVGYSFMEEPLIKVKDQIVVAQQICEKLDSLLTVLTTRYWPNYGPHVWKGPKAESTFLKSFAVRLKEVRRRREGGWEGEVLQKLTISLFRLWSSKRHMIYLSNYFHWTNSENCM